MSRFRHDARHLTAFQLPIATSYEEAKLRSGDRGRPTPKNSDCVNTLELPHGG